MPGSKKRVTVEIVRAGQERAYGDTVTEAIVTIERQPFVGPDSRNPDAPFSPWDTKDHVKEWHRDHLVKPAILALVGKFYEKGDPQADWASPMLKSLEEIEPGKWRVVIVSAYTD